MRYDQVSMAPPLTPVTRNIIIACVASLLVCYFGSNAPFLGENIQGFFRSIELWGGLVPKAVTQQYWLWQPFTYMFLHGSPMHLLVNMLLLWFFGPEIEMALGGRKFFLFYLTCGALGGLFNVGLNTLFFHNSMETPIIGASGAVYGVVAGFSVLFRDRYTLMWFLFPIKALYIAPTVFLMDLFMAMGAKDAVAHFTHLGGMLVGALYIYFTFYRTKGGRGKSKRDIEKEKLKRQFTLIVNDSQEKAKESSGPYWN